VEGFNFEPNTSGPLNFIPPRGVTLQVGTIQTDNDGHFQTTITLPRRQPVEEAQHIRAITRRNVGLPRFTRTARETWEKIIETVFLALLATTFGVVLSVTISFLAAQNLMKDVTSPMSSVALTLLAWPVGIWLGAQAAGWAASASPHGACGWRAARRCLPPSWR
jgi:hypothetical protein